MAKFVIKKNTAPKNDIVEENIRKMSLWNRISAKERKAKSELFRKRRKLATKKKEQLFMEKIKHNIYYMNRWNIVREKRKDIEEMQRLYERKQIHNFWWIRQQKTVAALKTIFTMFDNKRKAFHQANREKVLGKRIIRKLTKFLEKRGQTNIERNMQLVKMSQTA